MAGRINTHIIIIALIISLLGISCSNTRHLPAGDALYLGARINLDGPDLGRHQKKELTEEMSETTRPRPNKRFLGIRFKLFAYNLAGNPKKKGSPAGWLKYTVGEPPVLLSQVDLDYNVKVLQNTLQNQGFFQAAVTGDTTVKRKKAKATYTIQTGYQYTINAVSFSDDTTQLMQRKIVEDAKNTLLKPGKPFDLSLIKAERIRIDNTLKENGYYFFSPDYLVIKTDSTIGNHKVNLYIRLKPETPSQAKETYKINDVYIMPNYRLNATESDTSKQYATYYKGYYVVDRRKLYKPLLFEQSMQFEKGDFYNRTDHNLTINRLVSLGVFKFVKNRFAVVPGTDTPRLNTFYYLTPSPKKSIRAEINGNTKSNNLTGSSLTLGWRNRNTFRAGELFTIDATGGFEVQYSGPLRGFNTFRSGLETGLTYPRFITPFIRVNPPGGFVPKTKFLIGWDILNKQKLYTMNSFRLSAGYDWKESLKKEHQLNPISITYVQPLLITPLYEDSMLHNPTLQKAVEKQFILGSSYDYNYNGIIDVYHEGFYFDGTVDLSGNIIGLLSGASQSNPKYIFNAQFSQYVKLQSDIHYYIRLSSTAAIANRLILGIGMPYGNSRQLPFIKQFFAGGNNDLRAFRSRSVGPGIYHPVNSSDLLADQPGDIKLEFNTELRAKLAGILHGAIFADVGNVWLFNDDPLKPGGKFSGDFLKQLAVGTGAGLRFDISFLVLRFDVAFPLRKPWLQNKSWVLNQINFGSSSWRKNNLVFNLGIGYPF